MGNPEDWFCCASSLWAIFAGDRKEIGERKYRALTPRDRRAFVLKKPVRSQDAWTVILPIEDALMRAGAAMIVYDDFPPPLKDGTDG